MGIQEPDTLSKFFSFFLTFFFLKKLILGSFDAKTLNSNFKSQ